MPVPTHFKFTVRGKFLNTPEHWSFGFHMTRNQAGSLDAGLGDVHEDEVDDALVTFFGAAHISTFVEVEDWRCYVIGTNGKMQGNAPKLRTFEPGELKGGGIGSGQYPPQVALCATLVAPDRGPAQFGRMYIPGIETSLQDDWRIAADQATNWAGFIAQLLKDVSDAIDFVALGSASGCNVSPGPPGSSTGTLQVIDHIEIGRVLDTVKNRRRGLLEERVAGAHIDW